MLPNIVKMRSEVESVITEVNKLDKEGFFTLWYDETFKSTKNILSLIEAVIARKYEKRIKDKVVIGILIDNNNNDFTTFKLNKEFDTSNFNYNFVRESLLEKYCGLEVEFTFIADFEEDTNSADIVINLDMFYELSSLLVYFVLESKEDYEENIIKLTDIDTKESNMVLASVLMTIHPRHFILNKPLLKSDYIPDRLYSYVKHRFVLGDNLTSKITAYNFLIQEINKVEPIRPLDIGAGLNLSLLKLNIIYKEQVPDYYFNNRKELERLAMDYLNNDIQEELSTILKLGDDLPLNLYCRIVKEYGSYELKKTEGQKHEYVEEVKSFLTFYKDKVAKPYLQKVEELKEEIDKFFEEGNTEDKTEK